MKIWPSSRVRPIYWIGAYILFYFNYYSVCLCEFLESDLTQPCIYMYFNYITVYLVGITIMNCCYCSISVTFSILFIPKKLGDLGLNTKSARISGIFGSMEMITFNLRYISR